MKLLVQFIAHSVPPTPASDFARTDVHWPFSDFAVPPGRPIRVRAASSQSAVLLLLTIITQVFFLFPSTTRAELGLSSYQIGR
jgi:hypothetical protein